MKNKRSVPRTRVFKAAQIILSDKAPKLDCTARDVSTKGARLRLSTTYSIPADFDVIISGVRRRCHAIWRTDTEIGVAFQ